VAAAGRCRMNVRPPGMSQGPWVSAESAGGLPPRQRPSSRRSSSPMRCWSQGAERMSDPLEVVHPLLPGPLGHPQKFCVASMLPVQTVALSSV